MTTSIRVSTYHEAILTLLRTAGTTYGMTIVDGWVGEGESLPTVSDGESIVPVLVLEMMYTTPLFLGIGIAETKGVTSRLPFNVAALAGDAISCTRALDVATEVLEGYVINENTSEIECLGGPFRAPVPSQLHPYRFVRTIGFALTIDQPKVP